MKISIIVPVYNVEKYIERCMESILNQSYSEYEVILVDDGSKDDSSKICDYYSNMYEFVKVIHKKNEGLGKARNTGLEYVSGDFVMFIDSDDYIEKETLEILQKRIVDTGADTCLCCYKKDDNGNFTTLHDVNSYEEFIGRDVKEKLLVRMIGPTAIENDGISMAVWRGLYSIRLIKDNNIYFQSERKILAEDTIFDLLYYQYANYVVCCDYPGYVYCRNEGSLTEKYNSSRFILSKVLYDEQKTCYEKLGLLSIAEERLFYSLIRTIKVSLKHEVRFLNQIGIKCALDNIKLVVNDEYTVNAYKKIKNLSSKKSEKILDYLIKNKNSLIVFMYIRLAYSVKSVLKIFK